MNVNKTKKILFQDNFLGFPIGEFPYDPDHSATGEYHFVTENGYAGSWVNQVCNYSYNGSGASWIITEQDGKHYMEQMRIEKNKPHRTFPTLQTGDLFWFDYEVSVRMRRISTKGCAGLAFAMQNSINTLVFLLEDNKAKLVYRHKENVSTLAETAFPHDCDHFYTLSVSISGEQVNCLIDGTNILSFSTSLAARGGKIGITADCPTQFTDVLVQADPEVCDAIHANRQADKRATAKLQNQIPKMKLWKKIDLKNFGTSRQIRFGHLTGTDQWFIVLAQAQKRVHRDAYAHISCLTAIDLDGNILWQKGEPSDNSAILGKISADMPFQVYDINGDGKDEVICGRNFEIQILDGATGNVLKSAKTPLSDDDDQSLIGVPYQTYAFDRINPDGIRIANFSGKERPSDILIKDRYCRVYALNSELEVIWSYRSPKNTGHFPLAIDVNGDGYDELLCGYTLLDHNGKPLWTLPIETDHTDEIVAGKFVTGSEKGYFACVSGTQGFFICDFQGNIISHDYIGHAQRVSVGNYCPDEEGFHIIVSNFWGHQGILYFYDSKGNPIWEMENELNGNVLAPVNWKGDGSDLILLNADPARGGLIDGSGRQAVAFPDDGHPTMCCEAINLCGDARDELVVWDYHALYIYTQEDGPLESCYEPVKYPIYNASNYRGEYSFPDSSYLTFTD